MKYEVCYLHKVSLYALSGSDAKGRRENVLEELHFDFALNGFLEVKCHGVEKCHGPGDLLSIIYIPTLTFLYLRSGLQIFSPDHPHLDLSEGIFHNHTHSSKILVRTNPLLVRSGDCEED